MLVRMNTAIAQLPAPSCFPSVSSRRLRGRSFGEYKNPGVRRAARIAGLSVLCTSAEGKDNYHGAYQQFLDRAWLGVEKKASCLVKFPQDAFTHMHAPGRDGGPDIHIYGQAAEAHSLRYLRTLVIDQGPQLQVFNCCFFPSPEYDLPAFGADFVSMPRGSLAALDFQPLGNRAATVEAYVSRLQPLRSRFRAAFPDGGPMPVEASEFFSDAKIWTRFSNPAEVLPTLLQAFEAYLEAYLSLVSASPALREAAEVERLREGQHRYLSYRAEKDPAKMILERLLGGDETQKLLHSFAFNGLTTLGTKTFLDYFPQFRKEDDTINKRRSMESRIGTSPTLQTAPDA